MRYTLLMIILFIIILIPLPTLAYIDLGLGGQIFQLFYLVFFSILAFVVSPILFFWKKISGWVKTRWKRDDAKGK